MSPAAAAEGDGVDHRAVRPAGRDDLAKTIAEPKKAGDIKRHKAVRSRSIPSPAITPRASGSA